MSANNGGPAFPAECGGSTKAQVGFDGEIIQPGMRAHYSGMTLRDYFAAHAPITMADATKTLFDSGTKDEVTVMDVINILSKMRFAYADAMLLERAK